MPAAGMRRIQAIFFDFPDIEDRPVAVRQERHADMVEAPASIAKTAKAQKAAAVTRGGFRIEHRVEEFSVFGRPGSDLLFQAFMT